MMVWKARLLIVLEIKIAVLHPFVNGKDEVSLDILSFPVVHFFTFHHT
jgi:hypothetical protein